MIKRLLIALSFATVFVVVVGFALINYFYREKDEDKTPKTTYIEHLSERETRELFDELGMEFDPKPQEPNLEVPSYEAPKNDLDGFVYLDVLVKRDGSVASAEVVGAKPEGLYEDQAVKKVMASRYPVRKREGVAVAYQIDEIVEFDVAEQSK